MSHHRTTDYRMEHLIVYCCVYFVAIANVLSHITNKGFNDIYQNEGYYPSYYRDSSPPVYYREPYYSHDRQYPNVEDNYYNPVGHRWIGDGIDEYTKRGELHPYYNPYIEFGKNNYEPSRDNGLLQGYGPNQGRTKYLTKKKDKENAIDNDIEDSVEVHFNSHNEIIHGQSYENNGNFHRKHKPSTYHTEASPDHFKDMKDAKKVQSKVPQEVGNGRHDEYATICNFLYQNHYKYHMDQSMLQMACKMYQEWAYNMKTVNKWNPTTEQKNWFDSLGSLGEGISRKRQKRQARHSNRSLRREYRMMTDEQRYRFHRAVNILKNTFVDGLSMYDIFVRAHQARVAPGAHFGPAFLGYHRELLLRFEHALRNIDHDVSLPYWDSNLDYILGDELATRSILWTDDFLGNGIGEVTTGPFVHWRLAFPDTTGTFRFLYRNLTVAPPFARTMPALMSDEAIIHMLSVPSVRNLTWFISPVFESHHGAVHNWVGGIMADIPISPTDPVFYLHHAFLDCLWEQLRSVQRKRNPNFNPEYDYPNDTEALGVGVEQIDGTILNNTQDSYHYALNHMLPFAPLRNIDGHSDIYFNEFYACEPSPICTARNTDCGSPYLFCEIESQRCAPKLQLGTSCERVENSDACYGGVCCNGVCARNCNSEDFSESQFSSYRDAGVRNQEIFRNDFFDSPIFK